MVSIISKYYDQNIKIKFIKWGVPQFGRRQREFFSKNICFVGRNQYFACTKNVSVNMEASFACTKIVSVNMEASFACTKNVSVNMKAAFACTKNVSVN